MAERGDAFFNPVTHSRLVFVTTPRESGGRQISLDWFVPPGETLASAAHYHAGPDGYVVEEFELREGSARCRIGGQWLDAVAPHTFRIPCNTTHVHPRNSGETPMHVRQTITLPEPDLRVVTGIERFFETLVALSQQGRADRNGDIRNPLQGALTLNRTLLDPTFVAGVPRWLQKIVFGAVGAVAEALGYRAHLTPVKM